MPLQIRFIQIIIYWLHYCLAWVGLQAKIWIEHTQKNVCSISRFALLVVYSCKTFVGGEAKRRLNHTRWNMARFDREKLQDEWYGGNGRERVVAIKRQRSLVESGRSKLEKTSPATDNEEETVKVEGKLEKKLRKWSKRDGKEPNTKRFRLEHFEKNAGN